MPTVVILLVDLIYTQIFNTLSIGEHLMYWSRWRGFQQNETSSTLREKRKTIGIHLTKWKTIL